MDTILPTFFWLSLLYIFYAEAGYLALLWVISRFRSIKPQSAENTPPVTVLIAAYNEEKVIREKILNTFALDFPPEKVQVLVASDYSTDRTDEIVGQLACSNLAVI